jgi:signal transduction histidine kinase
VILATFATGVGILTSHQVRGEFRAETQVALEKLRGQLHINTSLSNGHTTCSGDVYNFDSSVPSQIRLFDNFGNLLCSDARQRKSGRPKNMPVFSPPYSSTAGTVSSVQSGYQVYADYITWPVYGSGWLLYARPLSATNRTISKVTLFLTFGVIGGSIFALLAGLFVAERAMRPVAELTEVAREIERTRDPTLRIPHPEADDEVAELARTLESMLSTLDAARADTESALTRQREFVADAGHELRTPLTSVLANLELLADELVGEQAHSAKAALRSTRRMRRLVGDLLLLARADAERQHPHRPTDLAHVLMDAAGELLPVAEDHELTVYPGHATVDGDRDDLHRLVLNLLENAISHTPAGTPISARTGIEHGSPVLIVEDNGPGISPELQQRVFDRFVRGGGDTGARGTGLGLAIVRAVADSHNATVTLGKQNAGAENPGTRFVIAFPAAPGAQPPAAPVTQPVAQTSTTTGRIIGRRRSRS